MRKLPGVALIDLTGRDPPTSPRSCTPRFGHDAAAVRFEKWQALGNDYLIVEARRAARSRSPRRASGACATATPARAATACSSSRRPTAGLRRPPADLQPRRLGGRAVGQRRPRGDPLPAPRGWTDADTFSIQTAAGEIRPTITGPTTCRVDMGRAALRSDAFPAGPADGRGERRGRRPRLALPARLDRQPAVRDPRRRPRRARGARPAGDRAGDRARARCSRSARTSPSGCRAAPDRDPRPDLRARRGGDDVLGHRAPAARRSPTCCAAATRR